MSVSPVPWVHPDIRRSWVFGSCRHPGYAPNIRRKRERVRELGGSALALCLLLLLAAGCADRQDRLRTFADHPGFKTLEGCRDGKPGRLPDLQERELLARYRPRLFVPPGGAWPIDFYRDYLPNVVLRDHAQEDTLLRNRVTRELLQEIEGNPTVYLDLVREPPLQKGADPPFRSVLYGRAYREVVKFRDEEGQVHALPLTFLKYNATFARSGLPARLPWGYEPGLRLLGLDPEDWHQLDHFCAIHVVLDEEERPVAALVAQHNHHRTYLIGKDLPLPEDGRLAFAIARRSNELYPDDGSSEPARHRVAPCALYFKYLLSGEEAPFFRGEDLTYGRKAGGGGSRLRAKIPPRLRPLLPGPDHAGPVSPLPGEEHRPERPPRGGLLCPTFPPSPGQPPPVLLPSRRRPRGHPGGGREHRREAEDHPHPGADRAVRGPPLPGPAGRPREEVKDRPARLIGERSVTFFGLSASKSVEEGRSPIQGGRAEALGGAGLPRTGSASSTHSGNKVPAHVDKGEPNVPKRSIRARICR